MKYSGFVKKTLGALMVVLFIGQSRVLAQVDYSAIERHIEREEFSQAAEKIRAGLGVDPKDDKLYYLEGVMNFNQENISGAKTSFSKGAGYASRNAYNFIGLGSVYAKENNFVEAQKNLSTAQELNKKNDIDILVKIGQAWLGTDKREFLAEAEKVFYKVTTLDAKSAEAYIGLGDLYDRQNVDELALSNYEKAIEFRPDFVKGWLRVGQIKKKMKDYKGAADAFQKAIELAPDFPPAYKEMGEMWILAGEIEKAREKYQKYLQMVNNDRYAQSRYAVILYLAQQYQPSLDICESLLKDTTMVTMLRLAFYNSVEIKSVDKSPKYRDQFFAKVDAKQIVHSDYAYEARLAQLNGDMEGAVAKYLKALEYSKEKEQFNPEYLQSISDLYRDLKNYQLQAEYLDKYMNAEGVKLKLSLLFNLGKAYYFAGNELAKGDTNSTEVAADVIVPEEAIAQFKKADSTFAVMIGYKDDLHIGWAWRGRANSKMDPGNKEGKGLTYYQKVLELIGESADAKTKYKQDFIEAHRYIGAYYTLVKEDCETALIHWNKIKEVDPENRQATEAIAFCNQ